MIAAVEATLRLTSVLLKTVHYTPIEWGKDLQMILDITILIYSDNWCASMGVFGNNGILCHNIGEVSERE